MYSIRELSIRINLPFLILHCKKEGCNIKNSLLLYKRSSKSCFATLYLECVFSVRFLYLMLLVSLAILTFIIG